MAEKGMSSKVLNMKFMRQAEIKAEEKEQEEEERKLRDLSEWETSSAAQLKAKFLAQKQKVRTVGFQTLNQIRTGSESAVIGRRTFGEDPKKAEKEAEEAQLKKESQTRDDDMDLDKMWKREQLSGNNHGTGKRTTSGSKRFFDNEEGSKKTSTKKRKSQP